MIIIIVEDYIQNNIIYHLYKYCIIISYYFLINSHYRSVFLLTFPISVCIKYTSVNYLVVIVSKFYMRKASVYAFCLGTLVYRELFTKYISYYSFQDIITI